MTSESLIPVSFLNFWILLIISLDKKLSIIFSFVVVSILIPHSEFDKLIITLSFKYSGKNFLSIKTWPNKIVLSSTLISFFVINSLICSSVNLVIFSANLFAIFLASSSSFFNTGSSNFPSVKIVSFISFVFWYKIW
jgi:hypothetical protein